MASTSGHIENSQANSDSEQSNESENGDGSEHEVSGAEEEGWETDNEEGELFDEDDMEYNPVWCLLTQGMRRFPFTRENKLLVDIPGDNKPIDWFLLLLDDDSTLQKIVGYTNQYAFEVYFAPALTPKSRINNWKPLTIPELKIFIGLLFHMGTIRLNRISDYWKTHRLFNLAIFREQMARDRFLLILRCLHFSDNTKVSHNRLNKVQLLLDWFNNRMIDVYYPGKDLSLDEGMVLWRGRLLFRQYIKGKRHKYGMKLYSLCEGDGLILCFTIYSGKSGPLSGKNHGRKVVMHLMRGKLDVGHSLYMDNFYNSFPLASELLRRRTFCTGTLRIDRKHLPLAIKAAKLKKGETIERYAEGVLVAKWKDKRNVLYLSTEFQNDMGQSRNRKNQPRDKPVPIIHYNSKMKGVDRSDQMMAYYPIAHKSLRWYKKIFVHIIQMLLINSFKLYNFANPDNAMNLYDFRLQVIDSLLPAQESLLHKRPKRCSTEHVLSKATPKDPKKHNERKRCRVCYEEGRVKKTLYFCAQCPAKPGLCPVPCYEKYHA